MNNEELREFQQDKARIALAMEVLSMLDDGVIDPTPGTYFSTKDKLDATSIEEALGQTKFPCKTCAMGALVVAGYRLGWINQKIGFTVQCWNTRFFLGGHYLFGNLLQYHFGFLSDELSLLEESFEQYGERYRDDYKPDQPDPELMRNLMNNIIRNDGRYIKRDE